MASVGTGTVTVRIAGEARSLAEAEPNWVVRRVNGLRREGQPVCLEVAIRIEGVRMSLASSECVSNGGGGRLPNRLEQEILALWDQMGLNQPGFNGGNANAFLERLRHLL